MPGPVPHVKGHAEPAPAFIWRALNERLYGKASKGMLFSSAYRSASEPGTL
jgi:hypothetical protein